MVLKKNITLFFLLLIFFLHTSCGYKKISQKSNNNYQILKMEITGDNKISNIVRNEILLNASNNGEKRIQLQIDLKKEKNISNKNIKGKITKYNLILIARMSIENLENKNKIQKDFTRKMNYNVSKAHSDTLGIEKKYIKILAENISEDIINFINLNLLDQ